MPDWTSARAVADDLAETGVDPLDLQAAQAARAGLLRRFVLDLVLIFGVAAVAMAVVLMLMRALAGTDPIGGREVWIGSAGLVLVLVSVALRSLLPGRAQAYEMAWAAFVEQVWPGAKRGDELGAARLAFVRRAAAGDGQDFPSAAPGRKI
ncbi:MAG TPA: hypothetical protein VGO65_09435 [Pseudolysinimonas sp.]|jgi:hypothetical protein|nr:hypothetical protein [Pseudolysinimonas sp.]